MRRARSCAGRRRPPRRPRRSLPFFTCTTSAELAFFSSRAKLLMPLTTTPPSSDAAGMTTPPGHMQKVNTARLRGVRDELIVGGRERRVAFAVLRPRDARLEMLDAHPHREILRFHMEAAPLQQLEGVARAVADGKDEERRFLPRAVHGDSGERAVCNTHVVELAAIIGWCRRAPGYSGACWR